MTSPSSALPDNPTDGTPAETTRTPEDVLESLAVAIHQGDWMMVSEWRWERATNAEREVSYRRARAMLDAYPDGGGSEEQYAQVIANIDWAVKAGGPGRLRAKAQKVTQWYTLRARGMLL